jgi:hypothetical protein
MIWKYIYEFVAGMTPAVPVAPKKGNIFEEIDSATSEYLIHPP